MTAPGKRIWPCRRADLGGADTADAKLQIMEACGFTVTRDPSEMGAAQGAAVAGLDRASSADRGAKAGCPVELRTPPG